MMQRKNTIKQSTTKSHTDTRPVASVNAATVVRRNFGTGPFDKHWLNMDCCGLFCASLTYFLHGYGCYAVCNILIPPWMSTEPVDGNRKLSVWGMLHTIIFCSIALLAVISHFKAMTTDPGAVPPDAEPIPDDLDDPRSTDGNGDLEALPPRPKKPSRMCRRCHSYKPSRAHHCSICKRCIIKMDHHCPWVNNCVGIGNHKYFLLFILYTFFSCGYAICLVTTRFFQCLHTIDSKTESCLDDSSHLLYLIFLTIESFLFGMFTSCMMIDQWDVVSTNVTQIDRLKGAFLMEEVESQSGVNEVFGVGKGKGRRHSSCRMDWVSPFSKVCFPDSMRDDVMGFCRPCTNLMKVKPTGDEKRGLAADIV